ncbi:MAG TPA: IS4 family transposase [Desulfobaccales bacterium]|nr:IS4 family transposase [Desulfobaccales bacterium]
MPRTLIAQYPKIPEPSFRELWRPVENFLDDIPLLQSRGDRPLQMTFEQQLKSLILFHLEEYDSARHLLQVMEQDDCARAFIALPAGISRSSYGEALNTRGLEQLLLVYEKLQAQAASTLPKVHPQLGDLVAIDGTLIDAVCSMTWADYSSTTKKAKIHLGFDINRGIPGKVCLTDGKGDEGSRVPQLLSPGQTGIMDRNYQCYRHFDLWQEQDLQFVCRIKAGTIKTALETYAVPDDGPVFCDALMRLGSPRANQTQRPVRVVGYRVDGKAYWVATNRFDLPATDIALIYKLRWEIEKFFGWWKQHLNVYPLIARSSYGFMVQVLGGLITYLLLAIYCHKHFQERVSINRVRELRINIQNEARILNNYPHEPQRQWNYTHAKT